MCSPHIRCTVRRPEFYVGINFLQLLTTKQKTLIRILHFLASLLFFLFLQSPNINRFKVNEFFVGVNYFISSKENPGGRMSKHSTNALANFSIGKIVDTEKKRTELSALMLSLMWFYDLHFLPSKQLKSTGLFWYFFEKKISYLCISTREMHLGF